MAYLDQFKFFLKTPLLFVRLRFLSCLVLEEHHQFFNMVAQHLDLVNATLSRINQTGFDLCVPQKKPRGRCRPGPMKMGKHIPTCQCFRCQKIV